MLIIVLGLAMVWLGFLYTYELKIADKPSQEESISASEDFDIIPSAASINASTNKLEKGFPIILAALGIVFLVGGTRRFRQPKVI
jgi:hypothetical protein